MEDLPADDLPPPPGGPEGAGRGFLPDAVRKAIVAGVTAVFLTEEGARRLARDWKLPKDLIAGIVGTASGAKDELLRIFGEEVRRFLESESVRREFWRALASMALEVKAEIRFKPAEDGKVEPVVKASVQARRPRRKAGP
ncbi:MAG TPA: hypothetical protein VLU43_15780 [Anaeromyxobacteraceae bacterium]|nr:hypothetical protein [Anaeromyxobacteraceae bacterium]